MPIYEYACEKCGKQIDVMQKVNDPAPETCEACGAQGTLARMVSRTSFVLKGGGWYSDLYGSTKKDGGSSSSSSTASTSATSSATAPSSGPSGSGTGGTSGSSSGSAPSGGSGGSGSSTPPPTSGAKPAAQGAAA